MSLSASRPWRAHYGDTPETLHYPDLTVYQLLARTAGKDPHRTAWKFQGRHCNYADLMARVDAAARGLTALGIGKGDRVCICLPNCPQTLDCFYALNRIGAVANMIHPLSAAKEIAFCLNRSQSKAILTLDAFYDKVASILPQLESECTVLVAKIADELPFGLNLLYPMTKAGRHPLPKTGYILWRELVKAKDPLPADTGRAEDPAVILYSGGTTGKPKGILLSNRNLNALALQTIAASGFGSVAGMAVLALLPAFHGFGLGIGIHTALVGGATCILVPQFNRETFARILLKQKPNIIPGVPTLFEAMLRAEALRGKDLSFLKGVFSGGDSLSEELKQKMDAFLREHHCTEQIRQGYGATECVAASCLAPRQNAREASIGVPFPDTDYKIVAVGTTQEVQPGVEGEICISGPTVMLGYLDDPAETAAALQTHEDGKLWLHTGDLGWMDPDGFVYFRQRIKRMIVTSGYNVYPSQLENVIDGHEKVRCCCVIGLPDPYRGQRVRAYVVPVPGVQPTEALKQEILAHCAQYIAKYALPREIEFREELPKTPVGKVAYRVLEAQAQEENT